MSLSASNTANTGSQLDQLELMMAKQREMQTQLSLSLKQARADVGYSPSFNLTWPQINSQTMLLSSAVLASMLMCLAMFWIWKTRRPASPVTRRAPLAPFYQDSGLAKPSGLVPAAAPVAAPALRQATINPVVAPPLPASSFAQPDFVLDDEPSPIQAADDYPVFSHTAPPAHDAKLDFEDSQVDFDLSDFDHDDDFLNQPLPSLSVTVAKPNPEIQTEDDEPMAVFVEGTAQSDSMHDMLEWDLNEPAAPAAPASGLGQPKLRASGTLDSELPLQFDAVNEPALPPAVPFIAATARAAKPGAATAPQSSPHLQLGDTANAPVILPYEFELSEDDMQWAAELDLARELAEVGQLDEAESLCQEVFTLGTEPMREYALYILTRLSLFKRA